MPIPASSYLDFNSEEQEVHDSHDAIIIIKDELGYEKAKEAERNGNSIPTLPREDLGYKASGEPDIQNKPMELTIC